MRGVSFTARDGEITGIIGPNGAGKTTIFRLIYTVLQPDSRQDADRRHRCAAATGARRSAGIGVLPDVRGLYPRLTAREHLRYFGALHGMRGADLEGRIDELARHPRHGGFHRPAAPAASRAASR